MCSVQQETGFFFAAMLLSFTRAYFCSPPPTVWQLGHLVGSTCCLAKGDVEETCGPTGGSGVWETDVTAHGAACHINLCLCSRVFPTLFFQGTNQCGKWHVTLMGCVCVCVWRCNLLCMMVWKTDMRRWTKHQLLSVWCSLSSPQWWALGFIINNL